MGLWITIKQTEYWISRIKLRIFKNQNNCRYDNQLPQFPSLQKLTILLSFFPAQMMFQYYCIYYIINAPSLISNPFIFSRKSRSNDNQNGIRTLKVWSVCTLFVSRMLFLRPVNCSAPGVLIRINTVS